MQVSQVLEMHLSFILKKMQKSQGILKFIVILKPKLLHLRVYLHSKWLFQNISMGIMFIILKKENKNEICFKGTHINQYKP